MEIRITTGTYNTDDYRVIKKYTNKKSAIKYLKTIGYPFDFLDNDNWNKHGINYTLSINK